MIFIFFSITGHLLLRVSSPLGTYPILQSFAYLLASIPILLLIRKLETEPARPFDFKLLWLSILLTRVIFVGYPPSDDVNRYLWEGHVLNQGFNPYTHAPDSPELEPFRDLNHLNWKKINHKNLSAIYPPLALHTFQLFASFSPEIFRLFLILIDLLLIWGIVKILKQLRLPKEYSLLYAMNPFVNLFTAGEAHFDVLYICAVIWGIYFFQRKRYGFTFFLLGMATMLKYFSLILLPVFLIRKSLRFTPLFLIPLLILVPFLDDELSLFKTLFLFNNDFQFNSLLPGMTQFFLGNFGSLCLTFSFFFLYALHILTEERVYRNALFAFAALFCILPTVHPWYLLILCPLVCFSRFRPFLILQSTMLLGLLWHYHHYLNTGIWKEPFWLSTTSWLPFLLYWIYDVFTNKMHHTPYDQCFDEARSISVVIPTHNEEEVLEANICVVKDLLVGIDAEIICVDGGSQDRTLEILEKFQQDDFHILHSPQKGRGFQIKYGITNATKDVVVVLHIDNDLPLNIFQEILITLNQNKNYIGGWCPMIYRSTIQLSPIKHLNNYRATFLKISFGDQLQFYRRKIAQDFELFPDLPLMEDIESCLRAKSIGPIIRLNSIVRVSDRKWKKSGRLYNVYIVFRLCLEYLWMRRYNPDKITSDYFYKKYYS